MFDKYIIGEDSIRNVSEGGAVVGFAFDSRISYYRGLGVSMVEPFEIRIDGAEPIPAESILFTLGDRTWTADELAADGDSRWELLDTATITALVAGGLPAGEHKVEITEVLRVSYLPFLSRTTYTRTVDIP